MTNWYRQNNQYKYALEWGKPLPETEDMPNDVTDALPKEDYLVPQYEISPEEEILEEVGGLSDEEIHGVVNEFYDTIIEQAQGCFDMGMDTEDTINKIATEIATEIGLNTKPSLEWAAFNTEVFGVIQDNFPDEIAKETKKWEIWEMPEENE